MARVTFRLQECDICEERSVLLERQTLVEMVADIPVRSGEPSLPAHVSIRVYSLQEEVG